MRQRLLFCCLFLFCLALGSNKLSFADSVLPKRIISLIPSITESLYLLGEEEHLVGVTTYCRRPLQAQEKEKVGSVKEASVEKIISLNPDLVIAGSLTNPKMIEKLRTMGIRVVVFVEPRRYAQMCDQFIRLALLVGKEAQARKVLKESDTLINAVKEKVRGLNRPAVFVQIGAKPLFAATGKYVINDFIEFSGADNIAADAASGLYSREEVLRKNPAVILIVTMGIAGEQEKVAWQRYSSIDAVRNKRIYIIDSEKFCSPTPLGFAHNLEEIATILHPEITEEMN